MIKDNRMKRSRMSYGDAKAADEKETYKRDVENKQFPFRRDVQTGAAMDWSRRRWGECGRYFCVRPNDLCPRQCNKM